jgi:DNA-binding response OmpR family regulator
MKILVADDDADLRALIGFTLTNAGFEVCTAMNGADALQIRLTPLEVKAIHLLMASAGRTVTVERLLAHIWGRTTSRERRTLKQLIYRLRHKVERDPAAPELLQTTPGAGYKFNAEYREPQ